MKLVSDEMRTLKNYKIVSETVVIKSRTVDDHHEISISISIRNTDPKSSVDFISSHLKSLRATYSDVLSITGRFLRVEFVTLSVARLHSAEWIDDRRKTNLKETFVA
jgi:hypothetical protein